MLYIIIVLIVQNQIVTRGEKNTHIENQMKFVLINNVVVLTHIEQHKKKTPPKFEQFIKIRNVNLECIHFTKNY